jgi:hypothetical protein
MVYERGVDAFQPQLGQALTGWGGAWFARKLVGIARLIGVQSFYPHHLLANFSQMVCFGIETGKPRGLLRDRNAAHSFCGGLSPIAEFAIVLCFASDFSRLRNNKSSREKKMRKLYAATAAATCGVAFVYAVPGAAAQQAATVVTSTVSEDKKAQQNPPAGSDVSKTLEEVAAPSIPLDDAFKVDIYGTLRIGIDYVDAGTQDDAINGRDYLSRVGINAKKRIGEGLALVGTVEYGLRSDNLVDLQQNGDPTLRLA